MGWRKEGREEEREGQTERKSRREGVGEERLLCLLLFPESRTDPGI